MEQSEPSADKVFVGRQPILDADQRIVAYELLFRGAAGSARAEVDDGVRATGRVLVNTFNHLGLERVLGDKRAFINVPADLLERDQLELLPAARVVLEILEDVRPTPAVLARCRALRDQGYRLALDDFSYRPELEPLLALAEFVKLDVRALGLDEAARQARWLHGRGLQLLAEKVETRAEFRACRSAPFGYYQGYFFARPETLSVKRLDPSTLRVMSLFNLVAGGAEPDRIEREFRQDVALSYNLLRYINSAGFGLTHKVQNVRHALVVLGHAKLARWLGLLLMAGAQGEAPNALFRTALTRARLCELLGAERLPAGDHDLLFMTGMFSLLEALLDRPLPEILGSLNLPPTVVEALVGSGGRLAPYLGIALACEVPDRERAEALARPLGIGPAEINAAQIAALGWAEGVG
jgi:EAL and modified HD-GYP domain-containing signal transduction protein